MAWLRPILLLAGALFIAVLIWRERRRPRQAPELASARTEQTTPERTDTRDRELHHGPPVIDWSHDGGAEPDPSDAVSNNAETEGPLPELVVDWPAEESRRIVTLRILPARQDRLAGRALRQGLAACGFRHGQFGIFHLAGEDGRVLISAASLVRPGMLDPATMDFQRFAGINVFAVLPGPVSTEVALERLAQVAVEVAARVGGRVQDDNSAPFSAGEAGNWRQRCLSAIEGAPVTARPAD